jgi:hypothetical protein
MQADPFSGIKEKTHLVPVLTLNPEKTLGTQKINVTYYNIFAGKITTGARRQAGWELFSVLSGWQEPPFDCVSSIRLPAGVAACCCAVQVLLSCMESTRCCCQTCPQTQTSCQPPSATRKTWSSLQMHKHQSRRDQRP